jgi:hypothetical protein
MAGVKNPNSDSTLDRRPTSRAGEHGVTIDEIESEVSQLCHGLVEGDELRATSLLFAILKQGTSLQKLQWFTRYDMAFIGERLEALRSAGLLFTGTLSTQYVLSRVPHSEGLVERITGQKVVLQPIGHKAPAGYDWERNLKAPPVSPPAPPVAHSIRKEKSKMSAEINGAAGAAETESDQAQVTCLKTPGCPRPAGHNGICKGQKMNRRRLSTDPPEVQRAANAERMRDARAEDKSYGRRPKAGPAKAAKAARNGRKPQPVDALTATATALMDPGYFKIEFEDEQDTISREGHGREGFARALKALHQEFAGGSNG